VIAVELAVAVAAAWFATPAAVAAGVTVAAVAVIARHRARSADATTRELIVAADRV